MSCVLHGAAFYLFRKKQPRLNNLNNIRFDLLKIIISTEIMTMIIFP